MEAMKEKKGGFPRWPWNVVIYVLLMAVISVALFFVFSWGLRQDRAYWEAMDYVILAVIGGGVAVFLFSNEVLRAALPQEIEETGRDLEMYQFGQPVVYEGPLLLVERQLRKGARASGRLICRTHRKRMSSTRCWSCMRRL